jgi:hypothetical protein
MNELIGREPAARAFLYTPAHLALETASRLFPVFRTEPLIVDPFPLMGAVSPSAGRAERVPAAVRSEPASEGQPPSEERGGTEEREALGVGPQRTDRRQNP